MNLFIAAKEKFMEDYHKRDWKRNENKRCGSRLTDTIN